MIEFLLSGGLANEDPNLSLGSYPSIQLVNSNINKLFSQVTTDQMNNGGQVYRCIYVLNNGDHISNASVWVDQADTNLSILSVGVAESSINVVATYIGFENQVPFGITFSTPNQADAISVGAMDQYDIFALWIMRTTPVGVTVDSYINDQATINIDI